MKSSTAVRGALAALVLCLSTSAAMAAPCDGLFPGAAPGLGLASYQAVIVQPGGASQPRIAYVSIHNPGAAGIRFTISQEQQAFNRFACFDTIHGMATPQTCANTFLGAGETFYWTVPLGVVTNVDILKVTAIGASADLLPIVSAELVKEEYDSHAGGNVTRVYDHITFVRDDCR